MSIKKVSKSKKKNLYRITTFLTSLIVMESTFSSYASGDYLDNKVEHTDEKFEDFKYNNMDSEAFYTMGEELEKLINEDDKADEVLDKIYEMELFWNYVSADETISDIYTTLDAENEKYDEKYNKIREQFVEITDQMNIYYNLVANSQYSDYLKDYMDDERDWEYILEYEPMTDEQKELISKETELSKEYDDIYNTEYNCKINGVKYNTETLYEAYNNGEIESDEYLEALAKITEDRNEDLGNLFLDLVEIRTELAKSYGYDNYADYAYEKIYFREYSPEDLDCFREAVKEYYSPFLEEIQNYYSLNYFEESSDSIYNSELTQEDCYDIFTECFDEISDDLYESFEYMTEHNLCNMEIDASKIPTSYTTLIVGNYNAPYLQIDANGSFEDLRSLIHEFGHFNAFYYASEKEYLTNSNNLDVDEMHSLGLEIIYNNFADELYGKYADEARCYMDFQNVYTVVEGTKEDAFQLEVYKNPDDLSLKKLNEIYYDVCEEYGDSALFYNSYYLSAAGYLEEEEIYEWVEISHTFQSPFYYISYAISMATIEELRDLINKDFDAGIDTYMGIVDCGISPDYIETIEKVGLNNPIDNPRFDIYSNNIRAELGMELVDYSDPSEELYDYEDYDYEDYEDEDYEDEDYEDEDYEDYDSKYNDESSIGKKQRDDSNNRLKDDDRFETIEEIMDGTMALYVILAASLAILFMLIAIVIVIAKNDTKRKQKLIVLKDLGKNNISNGNSADSLDFLLEQSNEEKAEIISEQLNEESVEIISEQLSENKLETLSEHLNNENLENQADLVIQESLKSQEQTENIEED